MNWINIHTDTLREVAFVGAEPTERATWICLLGWCCTQENGGVIEDCKSWGSRKWQQLCGITKEEVETESELYGYDGENLVVTFYPESHQKVVEAKRRAGNKGGRPKKTQGTKPCGLADDNHMANLDVTLKEGKVRKGKENTPCVEDCHNLAREMFSNIDAEWINSISRSFHSHFEMEKWTMANGRSLLPNTWKQRLRTWIEEKARKEKPASSKASKTLFRPV